MQNRIRFITIFIHENALGDCRAVKAAVLCCYNKPPLAWPHSQKQLGTAANMCDVQKTNGIDHGVVFYSREKRRETCWNKGTEVRQSGTYTYIYIYVYMATNQMRLDFINWFPFWHFALLARGAVKIVNVILKIYFVLLLKR